MTEEQESHTYTVPDGPKALRETLSAAQSSLLHSEEYSLADARTHAARLQRLINECERKRPTSPDGKHDNRHTPECGCEDKPVIFNDTHCAHRFIKSGWQTWTTLFPRRMWVCTKCLWPTRTYDDVDRMASRPIHIHMSVALPGYNTTTKWSSDV